MKKIIMIGNGAYSQTLKYYINTITDWKIVAYADEGAHYEGEVFNGLPIYNVSDIEKKLPPEEYEAIMGVGYLKMNGNRKRIFTALREKGYHFPNLIHPTAIINNTVMGEGNIILENAVFEPDAVIGNDIIFWSAVLIGHNTKVDDHNHFAACSLIAGNVSVEESCFLGNHSTIKDGVHLAHHTLVGAGTYVSKNSNPYDVIVPARAVTLEGKTSLDFI